MTVVLPLKYQFEVSANSVYVALFEWAQHEYAENSDDMAFIAEVFISDLMHYCRLQNFNFSQIILGATEHFNRELEALAYQKEREEFYTMLKVGDRIQIEKGAKARITGVILEVDFRNSTYIAKVKRDDNGQKDIFAWHIYQDEISVRRLTENNVPVPTAAELNDRDRWLNARRAWKKLRDKDSTGSFILAIESLDNYFHYPLETEQANPIEEKEKERQWYADMGDRLSE